MKFDQDLCLNLQYDFGKMNSTLGSVVPLAMFLSMIKKLQNNMKKYTICDHYKFHQLFVTNSIIPIVFNILINVTNLNNAIYNILVVM